MHSEEKRLLLINLRNSGESYGSIARKLNISRAAVQNIVNYKLKKSKKKRGPKPLIGNRQSMNIKRFIAKQNERGIKVTASGMISAMELCVSRKTANNWLAKNQYKYQKGVQKLQLTPTHKALRVKLISSWIHKNIPWESVVFTDEKRFTLDGPDNW